MDYKMKTMAIYDEENYFLSLVEVQKNPFKQDEWLEPPRSSDILPNTSDITAYSTFKFTHKQWVSIPDYSKADVYNTQTLMLETVPKGTDLNANQTLLKPPIPEAGEIVYWKDGSWVCETDNSHQPFFDKLTKERVIVNHNRELTSQMTELPPPPYDCYFDGDGWVLTPQGMDEQLSATKRILLGTLRTVAQTWVLDQSDSNEVPDFEINTWPIQAAEAEVWAKDPQSPTPFIDQIADARGIDREMLLNKALNKSRAYAQLVAKSSGKRQLIEEMIKKATSMETLNQITIPKNLDELT